MATKTTRAANAQKNQELHLIMQARINNFSNN
jgi:hypothetical protein